jgi:hypothetical protein
VTSYVPEPPDGEPSPVPDAGLNGLVSAGAPVVRPPAPPSSRWAGSATTFGPAGRLVGTGLVLAVGGWLLWANPIGAALWWVVVTPWVLRDLWKPARRR